MRTTITMDDHLLDRLKTRAAASGTTVSRLIEEAVRVLLTRPSNPSEPPRAFTLVTFGAGGQFSKYNVDKTAELIAAEDQERYRKRP
jgi:Ribbon-helix-helix protein, copG family